VNTIDAALTLVGQLLRDSPEDMRPRLQVLLETLLEAQSTHEGFMDLARMVLSTSESRCCSKLVNEAESLLSD